MTTTAPSDTGLLLDPRSVDAEPIRMLRAGISSQDGIRGVLVASARPRAGASTIATNLASSFAETGERVLLVDANLSEARAGASLGLDPSSPGLSQVVARGMSLEEIIVSDVRPGLDVLPAGIRTVNPGEVLASTAGSSALQTVQERYDITVATSRPLLEASDGLEVARVVDGVVLVVDLGRSRRRDVQEAISLVDRSGGARVIGICVNRRGRVRGSAGRS